MSMNNDNVGMTILEFSNYLVSINLIDLNGVVNL